MRRVVLIIWLAAGVIWIFGQEFKDCYFPWYVRLLISIAIVVFFLTLLYAVGPKKKLDK